MSCLLLEKQLIINMNAHAWCEAFCSFFDWVFLLISKFWKYSKNSLTYIYVEWQNHTSFLTTHHTSHGFISNETMLFHFVVLLDRKELALLLNDSIFFVFSIKWSLSVIQRLDYQFCIKEHKNLFSLALFISQSAQQHTLVKCGNKGW